MQLVSVVLRVLPQHIDATVEAARAFANVEIEMVERARGVIIALVSDDVAPGPLPDTLTQLQLLPYVQACSVAFEFFEPTQATSGENHG